MMSILEWCNDDIKKPTLLENVFRFPTKTVSPSIKYAYSVERAVRTMYLSYSYELKRLKRSREGDAHKTRPMVTTGFDFSKSILYPYSAVPAATNTLSHPRPNRISVCRWICLNKSGLDKYCVWHYQRPLFTRKGAEDSRV